MIMELRADVDSTAVLQEEFGFTFEHKNVCLIPRKNKDGRSVLSEISIRKRIPDDAFFKTESRPPTQSTPALISVVGDEAIGHELRSELQFIESLLALYGVQRIYWDLAKASYIPETDVEKQNLKVYAIRVTKQYPPIYLPLKTDWMDERIGRLRDLTIPLAFFREGTRSYYSFNYIAAFQSFYFVLEGYYAKASHKNQEKTFLSDPELLSCAQAAYSDHIQHIEDKLRPMFESYKLTPTPQSLLRLAVKVRHRLHHYFHETAKETHFGTPFSQELYQPVSLALMLLCIRILVLKGSVVQRKQT
ncbi:MAG: hypothetical protein ABSD99_06305 [Candidatus Bathyarchaeia archaeon]|jgi:hypothetical protein